MNKPLKINNIIVHGRLSRLLVQVQALARLEQLLQELLPEALRPHCHVLAVHEHTLVLAADSPVWASRLRFHAGQLQQELAGSTGLEGIRIRVRPPRQSPSGPARRAPVSRSRQTADALRQAARTISDPALKTALLKLAGRPPGKQTG